MLPRLPIRNVECVGLIHRDAAMKAGAEQFQHDHGRGMGGPNLHWAAMHPIGKTAPKATQAVIRHRYTACLNVGAGRRTDLEISVETYFSGVSDAGMHTPR